MRVDFTLFFYHVHKREYIGYGYTKTLQCPKIMDLLKTAALVVLTLGYFPRGSNANAFEGALMIEKFPLES